MLKEEIKDSFVKRAEELGLDGEKILDMIAIEEATHWEVLVGPRECSMLPKYLKEVWI
ncbi:MAG: hypothetical protein JW787_14520 [Sedimentisphaerales bacterium]|nr:hypothetical protein [Sedimentisphaerales bacterium]